MNDRTRRGVQRHGSSCDDDDDDDDVEDEGRWRPDGTEERARPRPGEIMIIPADVSGP